MKYSWYRFDNSAIVYQMILTPRSQSLFRLGATLNERVNPYVLQQAAEKAFERHPYFRCELKRGFFRPYLDENKLPFPVERDDGLLLKLLDFRQNNRYLLRVTYFGTRIFVDFFHGLCDATGGMEFLKTLLSYYAEATGRPIPGGIPASENRTEEEETEDAFKTYYRKPDFRKGVSHMAGGRAYQIKGKRFTYGGYGLIQATVDTASLLAVSRAHSCSVTVLFTALMLFSILKTQISGDYKGNLTAFIPVNLRKIFPSKTLKNFTVFAKVVLEKTVRPDLTELIGIVKEKLTEQLDPEELTLKLGFSTLMATMPFLKYMPLFLKTFFSKVSRKFAVPKQTFILSNLGVVDYPDDLVRGFFFNLNCNAKTPDNVAVASFAGKTTVSFTRKIVSTEIERVFCSELARLVGGVEVISNFREESDAL